MDGDRIRRVALTAGVAFVGLLVAFWVWWPLGVALGLVVGVIATLFAGRATERAARLERGEDAFDLLFEQG